MRTTEKQNKRGNPNWQKGGASPNPGGRPKSAKYADAARRWLDTNAEELVEKHGAAALGKKPDLAAARMLIEYAEGKPRQSLSVAVDDRMKGVIESGVAALVATGLTEEEAREYLSEFVPEASQWTN